MQPGPRLPPQLSLSESLRGGKASEHEGPTLMPYHHACGPAGSTSHRAAALTQNSPPLPLHRLALQSGLEKADEALRVGCEEAKGLESPQQGTEVALPKIL